MSPFGKGETGHGCLSSSQDNFVPSPDMVIRGRRTLRATECRGGRYRFLYMNVKERGIGDYSGHKNVIQLG